MAGRGREGAPGSAHSPAPEDPNGASPTFVIKPARQSFGAPTSLAQNGKKVPDSKEIQTKGNGYGI